jgi:hypothetical protein
MSGVIFCSGNVFSVRFFYFLPFSSFTRRGFIQNGTAGERNGTERGTERKDLKLGGTERNGTAERMATLV